MKKILYNFFPIFLIIIFSYLLSKISYSNDKTIITIEFLSTSSCALFGAALTILALLFTIIDRYKENCEKNIQKDILYRSLPVLKNIGDDVIGIFIIMVILFFVDILQMPIEKLQGVKFLSKIDIMRFLLILFLLFLLYITFDITIVVIKLIKGLFYVNLTEKNDVFEVSLGERNLLNVVRKLKPKYIDELKNYLKILYTKQEIEESEKDK